MTQFSEEFNDWETSTPQLIGLLASRIEPDRAGSLFFPTRFQSGSGVTRLVFLKFQSGSEKTGSTRNPGKNRNNISVVYN
jgi:hypothetical protein